MKEKEKNYLKWKYLYYNGQTEVSDHEFDKLEDELKKLGSSVINIVGSPNLELLRKYDLDKELSVGEREVRFKHDFPMLSLKKQQVKLDDNGDEIYPTDILNFFNKVDNVNVNVNCTPKFDGNSMELLYLKGEFKQALTRGNEYGGLDRTKYIKTIVPNVLPDEYKKYDKIIIRGEVIIETKKWEEKYSDSKKVDNPRNWLAGKLNADDTSIDIFNDVDFMAYHIIITDDKYIIRPNNQLLILSKMGFDEVFNLDTSDFDDFFTNIYPEFKKYRANSKYALDGIVLTYPPNYWEQLGVTNHHPHWSCAVKFIPNIVSTIVKDVNWKLGKDGEYTPIAVLEPVELDGTIVKHASMHNLGWIIDNNVYPGCSVEIAKKGEIIPQIIKVIKESDNTDEYKNYIENYIENHI